MTQKKVPFMSRTLVAFLFFVVLSLFSNHSAYANLPFKKIEWPLDDRAHLDDPEVVTEWWYYVGKLTASHGQQTRHFSYYVTLRTMRDLTGDTPILDAQITDIENNKIYGNSVRLVGGNISSEDLEISSKNFMLKNSAGKYILKFAIPTAEGPIGLDLTLTPKKQPLNIGADSYKRGLIDMGNNTNSFYYSITRLHVDGSIMINQEKFTVDPDDQFSRSWMDHQWGDFSISQVLKTNPWIWIAIQLSDGTDINLGEFVSPIGQPTASSLASISLPNGKAQYKTATITPSNELEDGYPRGYEVQIDDCTYELQSIVPGQVKNDFWMGIMSVNGKDILEPNAPYAIVENTLPPIKTDNIQCEESSSADQSFSYHPH